MSRTSTAHVFFRVIAKSIDLMIFAFLWNILSNPGLLLGILYLLISDGVFKGKSIGKKLMRIRVINYETGKPGDFRDSVLRNILLATSLFLLKIPIIGWLLVLSVYVLEFLIIIGDNESKRLGDYLAKTAVIEE